MTRSVGIVPHTHWDREWYSPFQTFRLALVDMLDDLLPRMERDPSYTHFLLDGQMAMVDDYLAVRPEAARAIRRLATAERLAMGPWYVLPDQFMVSGETLVRNLQRGIAGATAFGGAMPIGYLPDMFGHVAQMPQLLRLAGIDHAVVWRGVPAAIECSAFWWSAPDGSTVRAEYLVEGYGNGAGLPDDAKALLGRIEGFVATHAERLGDGPVLWMNGTDHARPSPWLGRVVAEANELQDVLELTILPLAEHLRSAPTEGLDAHTGELRSGARANLLMGVASTRVDVKIAAARAERSLERRAEPLSALFLPAERFPTALLDEAWGMVVRNAAHDSSCACSIDEVCDLVISRHYEARQIGDGLAERALQMVARTVDVDGPVIVNPSARTRSGLVEVVVPGAGPLEGTQVLEERADSLLAASMTGEELGAMLESIRSQELEPGTYVNAVEIDEGSSSGGGGGGDGVDITLHADRRLLSNFLVEEVKAQIYGLVAARPNDTFRVSISQPPSRRVLAVAPEVPGFGWAAWTPAPLAFPPVTADGTTMANTLVAVEVDSDDGTFALDGLAGLDRLVDGGDHGDTYNYSPPEHDVVVDRPDSVSVSVLEAGPVRGRLLVTRSYRWPERVDDATGARVGERVVDVRTILELRAGERLVRVTTELDNVARDHRLRAHFPLPSPATTSVAECAFGTVERGTVAEGGLTERALPTYPSRRFVRAGGLTVFHEGLLEYELVDLDLDLDLDHDLDHDHDHDGGASARSLALTLLRATGMLSRVTMRNRPLPAGPPLRVAGAQVPGPRTLRYAVAIGGGRDDVDLDPYATVDDAFLPLEVVTAVGLGDGPSTGRALAVDGAVVSSLRRVAGQLEVRVFNPGDVPTTVTIEGRSGWLVDLRGRPLDPFDGQFPLGPRSIATALVS